MAQYITCPDCGANLDPEEKCDCRKINSLNCVGREKVRDYIGIIASIPEYTNPKVVGRIYQKVR